MSECKRIDLSELLSCYRGAVMGICALAILFFHDWVITVSEFPVIGTIESLLKNYGYYGVDVFFLLSGVGLAYSMKKEPGVKQFYVKRLKRVYVPYLEVIVLKALMEKWTVGTFVSRALCVELFTRGIYALLWFIPFILWLYLLYPLLHCILDRCEHDTMVLATFIGAVVLLAAVCGQWVHPDFRGLIERLPVFLLGTLIGRENQRRHVACTPQQCAVGTAILVFIYFALGWLKKATGLWILEAVRLSAFSVLFSLTVSGLCAWIQRGKNLLFILGRCGSGILRFLGGFTLEIYCVTEFYWQLLGGLEGRLTYLQINLMGMVTIPAIAYVMRRINKLIWLGTEKLKKRKV